MASLKDAVLGNLKYTCSEKNVQIFKKDVEIFNATLGANLRDDTKIIASQVSSDSAHYTWPGIASLSIKQRSTNRFSQSDSQLQCYDVTWIVQSRDFVCSDTIALDKGYWYGGAEMYEQHWPINKQQQRMMHYVTSDFFQGKNSCGDLLERFWFNSHGIGIYVEDDVPLHVAFNVDGDGKMVLKADYEDSEYKNVHGKRHPQLRYTICVADDLKKLWTGMYREYYDFPSAVPDERMFKSPIWSTWARYKVDINQEKVMEYASEILKHGFSNSQLELDDMYTTRYGEFDFDPAKFPDPKKMIDDLRKLGFRFTSWMHPFANYDSKAFAEGVKKGYWVKDAKDKTPALTTWWQGVGSIIDPTNKEAYDWFVTRLKEFQHKYGIDSFKFDAGEADWLPAKGSTSVPLDNPCKYTTQYVDMVANFGPMIEVRVGYKTQKYPIFVRMMDKHSTWGYENGLKTMIPSALLMSMLGYHFILPDMIGGNGYADNAEVEENPELWAHTTVLPSKELFIRWTQVSAYLPSMQFSIAPWQYDQETVDICRQAVKDHEDIVTPIVLESAKEAVNSGTPIIRPMWWHDQEDEVCLKNDSQFFVGDTLLVAPILEDKSRKRDVYLPKGRWSDTLKGGEHQGPKWLRDYDIELKDIGSFTLQN